MLRGIYTSESGMIAQMHHLNVISNNLANLNTNAFKKDAIVFKSFPEMLLREFEGRGVVKFTKGSYDLAPYIGKLPTGVSINQKYVDFKQGSLKETHNPFDLTIAGLGFFVVKTDKGLAYTRDGSFMLDKDSYLVNQNGYKVQGENGDIRIKQSNFRIDELGNISVNSYYNESDLGQFTQESQNTWQQEQHLDRLAIVDFYDRSALAKHANNLYLETEASGASNLVDFNSVDVKIHQGFIEGSNVNPIFEMTQMIEVHRSYDANQKALSSQDELLSKLIDQVIKI